MTSNVKYAIILQTKSKRKKRDMDLSSLDLTKSLFKIRLAAVYEPTILRNSIVKRQFNGFLYILNGTYTYKFKENSERKELVLSRDNLIYLPSDCKPYSYTVETSNEALARSIQIEFEITNRESNKALRFSESPMLVTSHLTEIKESMLKITECLASSYKSDQLMAYSELIKILSLAGTDKPFEKTEIYNSILPAIKFIEKNYTKKIPSSHIAALCSMSESQLRRCFKSALGISPKAYQSNLLLKSAKNLLSLGEFSIGEISDMLGFYDIYAFSHFFTKKTGRSPRNFANK